MKPIEKKYPELGGPGAHLKEIRLKINPDLIDLVLLLIIPLVLKVLCNS